jgi:small neutral amino acid transporter SnatA (MarC family)
MAQEPDSLAFRFAVVLALALIVLAATMWAAPRMLRTILLRRSRIATRFTGLNISICFSGSESSRRADYPTDLDSEGGSS